MDENNMNNGYQSFDQSYQQPQQQFQQQNQQYQQPIPPQQTPYVQPMQPLKEFGSTEKVISFVLGFLLGLIGTLIAWAVYKDGYDNPEAIKWSLFGLLAIVGVSIMIAVLTTCGAIALAGAVG